MSIRYEDEKWIPGGNNKYTKGRRPIDPYDRKDHITVDTDSDVDDEYESSFIDDASFSSDGENSDAGSSCSGSETETDSDAYSVYSENEDSDNWSLSSNDDEEM
jgi:hypothetical protein